MQDLNQEVYILAYSLLAPFRVVSQFFSFLPRTRSPEVSRPGSSVSHPGQKPLCADVTTPPESVLHSFWAFGPVAVSPLPVPNRSLPSLYKTSPLPPHFFNIHIISSLLSLSLAFPILEGQELSHKHESYESQTQISTGYGYNPFPKLYPYIFHLLYIYFCAET